jgi:hypothetical protein
MIHFTVFLLIETVIYPPITGPVSADLIKDEWTPLSHMRTQIGDIHGFIRYRLRLSDKDHPFFRLNG